MWERIPLNYYVLAALLNFLTSAALACVVLFKRPTSRTNQTFSVFAFTVAGWSLCYFLWLRAESGQLAEVYLRTLMVFVIFIPTTFTHFILTLLKVDAGSKRITLSNYLISSLLALTAYTRLFATDIGPFLVFPYWLKPRLLFFVHTIHFFVNTIYAHYVMLRTVKHHSGILRNQVLYVFIGTAIGYLAGSINYLTWFRVPIPPFLNPLVSVYVAAVSYAIVKYHLMDIRLAITRGTLFVLLHAFALGVPFFVAVSFESALKMLAGARWWMIPFGLLAVFASVLPAVFRLLQAHAEEQLFKKERQYQAAIRTMSQELVGFADVKSLCGFVSRYVAEQMGLASADLLVQGDRLGATHVASNGLPPGVKEVVERWVAASDRTDSHLLAEEGGTERSDVELRVVRTWLGRVGMSALVPGALRGELVSCLVLGSKRTGEIFTSEDFEVLEALTRQSALLVTNLRLYAQVAEQTRLLQFGELMNAAGHEFNNILAVLSGPFQLMAAELPAGKHQRWALEAAADILRGRFICLAMEEYKKQHTTAVTTWSVSKLMQAELAQAQKERFAGAAPRWTIRTQVPDGVTVQGTQTIPQMVRNSLRCLGWACEDQAGTLQIVVEAQPEATWFRFCMTGGMDLSTRLPKEVEPLAPEPGRHGGLYFFLARLIVADHAGSITVESSSGGGTTLIVRLPHPPPPSGS